VSAPGSAPDATPEPADAAAAQPSPPAEPVRTFKAPTPEPKRAGGYVLTERGWEIDTATPEQEK